MKDNHKKNKKNQNKTLHTSPLSHTPHQTPITPNTATLPQTNPNQILPHLPIIPPLYPFNTSKNQN